MRAALLLPCVFALAAATTPIARHGGHDDMDGAMMEGGMEGMMESTTAAISPEQTAPAPAAVKPASDGHGHGHDSKPAGPPDPHGHHSHAPVKEFLNDTEIHLWHKFPPTYLDADFRLTQDSVIFGEELPADWPGDTPSHPGLMILHVVSMCLAYFGALPIGEYWSLYLSVAARWTLASLVCSSELARCSAAVTHTL